MKELTMLLFVCIITIELFSQSGCYEKNMTDNVSSRSNPAAASTANKTVDYDVSVPFYDYTAQSSYEAGVDVIQPTGYFEISRRYVHAPRVEWIPVTGATQYRLILTQSRKILSVTLAENSPHYIEEGWDKVKHYPPAQITIEALDGHGKQVGLSLMFPIYKAPDYDPAEVPSPKRDYRQAAIDAFHALYNFKPEKGTFTTFPTEGPASKIHPSLLSAAVIPPDRYHNRAFPALHDGTYAMMAESLLKIADEKLKSEIIDYTQSVGDHILLSRVNEKGYQWNGLVWSAVDLECKPALGAPGAKGELAQKMSHAVDVSKCGLAGEGLVIVYEITGKQKYLTAANEMAEIFINRQNEDGSWPARVDAKTGEVLTEYNTCVGLTASFLHRLNKHVKDKRFEDSRDKAIQWMFDNPVKTFAWFTNYDDGHTAATKDNIFLTSALSCWDMLFFVRFICKNPELAPGNFDERIRENLRWVDNHFVWYGPDPILPYDPFYPVVGEQGNPNFFYNKGNCWVPMAGHTANWGLTRLALYQLQKQGRDLELTRAAANVLTHYQLDTGGTITFLGDRTFGNGVNRRMVPGYAIFWKAGWAFSAMFWAELAEQLEGEDKSFQQ